MAEAETDEVQAYFRPDRQERIDRANQFLLEYTKAGAQFSVSYRTLKHHYFSYCRLLGLSEWHYSFSEILHVLIEKSLLRNGIEQPMIVLGLRMKHPVGLAKYYNRGERKGITIEVKREVFRKLQDNGNICGVCGLVISSTDKVHIDHILPVRSGGTNEASNLQVVHKKCNLVKG